MVGSAVLRSHRRPLRSLSSWLHANLRVGVGLVAALLAAPALAQPTAQQVADRAIASIRLTSDQVSTALEAGKSRAVAEIERLDRVGATDQRIIAFGHTAVDALQRRGQAGHNRIDTIARNAVVVLHRLNATQELIDSVVAAAQSGRQAISQAQQRSVGAVREAVAEAIGPP